MKQRRRETQSEKGQKKKKGEIVKQRGADIKTKLFFALLYGEFTLYD